MYKNEKRSCKVLKITVFPLDMQICDVFVPVVLVAQAPCYFADYQTLKPGNRESF